MNEGALYSEDAFRDAVIAGDPRLPNLVRALFQQGSGATRERIVSLVLSHSSDATLATLFEALVSSGSVPELRALEVITEAARGRRALPAPAEEALFALAAAVREFRVLALEQSARGGKSLLQQRMPSLTSWLADGDAGFVLAYARVLAGLREELSSEVRAALFEALRGLTADSTLSANERQLARMALLTWDCDDEETLVTIASHLESAPHSAQECADLLRFFLAKSPGSVRSEVRAASERQWRRSRAWWQRLSRPGVDDLQIYAAAIGLAAGDESAGDFLRETARSRAGRRTRGLALCELVLSSRPEEAKTILERGMNQEAGVAAWAVSQLYRSPSPWWHDLVAELVEHASATELRVAASECIVAFREQRVSPAS